MRNPLQFVAAIRKLVALANVAILAAERFAASFKRETPQLCCATTSRERWRYRHGDSGDRHDQWMPAVRFSGMGNTVGGTGRRPTHHSVAQGS